MPRVDQQEHGADISAQPRVRASPNLAAVVLEADVLTANTAPKASWRPGWPASWPVAVRASAAMILPEPTTTLGRVPRGVAGAQGVGELVEVVVGDRIDHEREHGVGLQAVPRWVNEPSA